MAVHNYFLRNERGFRRVPEPREPVTLPRGQRACLMVQGVKWVCHDGDLSDQVSVLYRV